MLFPASIKVASMLLSASLYVDPPPSSEVPQFDQEMTAALTTKNAAACETFADAQRYMVLSAKVPRTEALREAEKNNIDCHYRQFDFDQPSSPILIQFWIDQVENFKFLVRILQDPEGNRVYAINLMASKS